MKDKYPFLYPLMMVILFISLLQLVACTRARIPMTKVEVPMVGLPLPELPIPLPKIPLLMSGEGDYRLLPWKKAFRRLCDQIEKEYPYTEWKNISWSEIRNQFEPKIELARAHRNRDEYYLAIREFLYSIPDANIRIEKNESLQRSAIGGGFGFALCKTVDNQYIAYYVHHGSSAEKARMKPGAIVLQWNRTEIDQALAQVNLIWSENPPGTEEGKLWERLRLLTRAPIGAKAEVLFLNPGEQEPTQATLIAEDDNYATLIYPVWRQVSVGPLDNPIEKKILPPNYGYIHIRFFAPSINTPFPNQAFQKIVSEFIKNDIDALIIDLRGNTGGDPEWVPKFAGYFIEQETFYQDLAYYNEKSKEFKTSPGDRLIVKPFPLKFRKPIVILIDYGTSGSAEGFAKVLSSNPKVTIMGVCNSRGAVGIPGGDIRMPTGITLSYPIARSLNSEGQIQIEADATGKGGIEPTIKLPINHEYLIQTFTEKKDYLLDQAIKFLSNNQNPPS